MMRKIYEDKLILHRCFAKKSPNGRSGNLWKIFILGLSMIFMCLFFTACGDKSKDKNVNQVKIYSFGDYIDPDLIDEFEEQTGIKVIIDTFDTNEEMFPVIDKGAVKYDVICTSDYMVKKLISRGKLAKLDYDKIPNKRNIAEKYLNMAAKFDKDNAHSIPHTYGTMGIMYDTKKIKKGSIKSWHDLWDKKYSEQIVMPDSMRDLMGIGLKAKGYSINSKSRKEVAEAASYLKKQKELVYKYSNDAARDAVIAGYTQIAVIWSGEVMYAQEENPDLEYAIPEEGTQEFMDMWAIPANATNKENGEKWIDFMLSKEAAMKNFEYLTYAIPNKYVIDSLKDDPYYMNILFPNDKITANCEFLEPMDKKDEEMYGELWKSFKTY